MQRHRIGSKEAMAEFMKNGRTSPIRPITRRSTSDKLRLRYKALRLWLGPFFPITLVVIPDECQSMPMTAPNDWNQKGMSETAQQLIAPVMVHDRLTHHGTETGHAIRKPARHASAMKREEGTSRSARHRISLSTY